MQGMAKKFFKTFTKESSFFQTKVYFTDVELQPEFLIEALGIPFKIISNKLAHLTINMLKGIRLEDMWLSITHLTCVSLNANDSRVSDSWKPFLERYSK